MYSNTSGNASIATDARCGYALNLLPPANEVCEGYVFTPVCQSFCSQGVSRATPKGEVEGSGQGVGSPGIHLGGGWEVWPGGSPGPCPGVGLGVWPQGLYRPRPGESISVCTEVEPSPQKKTAADGNYCGLYASYWNAFLFVSDIRHPALWEVGFIHTYDLLGVNYSLNDGFYYSKSVAIWSTAWTEKLNIYLSIFR